jgi:8-oxo-dGTP pyrophosphatase MutT (NUDIX family)
MTTPNLSKIPGFNPRQIPVIGNDAHLPAIDPARLHAAALRQRFAHPPVWTPELMIEPRMVDKPLRDAAVLVPIVMRDAPTLLLTQRAAQLKAHSGQIAFAGGKVDETDASVQEAATREAWEEIGLAAQHIEVIGELSVYTTGTAFRVTPVVALVQPGFELTLNPGEVDAAFEVPLSYLMDPANHLRHEVEWDFGDGPLKRSWFSMPYVEPIDPETCTHPQDEPFVERFIWGATAGMLRNLYRFLAA